MTILNEQQRSRIESTRPSLVLNVTFPLFKGVCLQDFTEFITNIDNAPDVFSSAGAKAEKIEGINGEIADREVLRREGAKFRVKGRIFPPTPLFRIGIPVNADFQVIEYNPNSSIKVASTRFETPYFASDISLQIGWSFAMLEEGFVPNLHINAYNIPQKIMRLVPNAFIKEELIKFKENLSNTFMESYLHD